MAFRHAAAAALLATSLIATLPAAAELSSPTGTDEAQTVAEARRALVTSTEEMVAATVELKRSETVLAGAVRETRRAADALAQARERHRRAVAAEAGAASAEAAARRQLAATVARIVVHERTAGAVARTAYQRGPVSEIALVLEAETPADLLTRISSIESVLRGQGKAIDQLTQVRAQLAAQRLQLAQALVRRQAARATARDALTKVRALERRAQQAQERASRSATGRRMALASAKAQLAEDERRYAELVGEATRLQNLLRKRVAAAGASKRRPAPSQGTSAGIAGDGLLLPVKGRFSSPYGMRRHPVTGVYKLHTGQDIAAPCGTGIRVALGGTVLQAGFNRAYGYRTVVSHGTVRGVDLTTTYNHQSSLGVRAGERVARGQVIGRVGTTGYSTGCHLHFEVLVNGEFVNPTSWL